MKRSIILLPLAFILFSCFAITANACSCGFGGGAPCQEYWRSDVVFAGTVVGSSAITVGQGSIKSTRRLVHFTIQQPLRGIEGFDTDVVTGLGGGDCGYGFKTGESYLVYANRGQGEDKRLYTGICTRTRKLADANDDFAFIRSLATAAANGIIFGEVVKRNYEANDGKLPFRPVANAELTIEGDKGSHESKSDEQGKFRVEGVAAGNYKVKLKLPDGLLRNALVKDEGARIVENEITVAERGCAQSDFYLEADTRISGRVIDGPGLPVAGLRLDLRGAGTDKSNINVFLHAQTDAEGRFEFTIVPPGDYLLGMRLLNASSMEIAPYPRTYYPGVLARTQAKIVSVKEGERLGKLELIMPPRLSDSSVEGIVVWPDGKPAAGASVYVNLFEEGEMSAFFSTLTDDSGRFTLRVFAGLQYKVSAFMQGPTRQGLQSAWIAFVANDGVPPLKLVLPSQ